MRACPRATRLTCSSASIAWMRSRSCVAGVLLAWRERVADVAVVAALAGVVRSSRLAGVLSMFPFAPGSS